MGEREALRFRVEVVELQRRAACVVPAEDTTAACLLDEDALHSPATVRDVLLRAQHAPVGASAVEPKDGPAVAPA
jgi:hypothetical protein